jgi:hypothetical protein
MATRMHTTKKGKKNYIKEKSRYRDLLLVAANQTPPMQHQKSISKSDASKKKIEHNPVVTLIIARL